MGKRLDLIGEKFGRLTVLEFAGIKNGKTTWLCECECEKTITVNGGDLSRGHTQSCGCLKREKAGVRIAEQNLTHGQTGSRAYETWISMKSRCLNKNYFYYKNHGGRGIRICERWMKFENFYADMGERPNGRTLDRINNDGNYEPENCRWATAKEQHRNKRNNRTIKYQGEIKCLAEWAEELNVNYWTLWSRLKQYPPQIAFNM